MGSTDFFTVVNPFLNDIFFSNGMVKEKKLGLFTSVFANSVQNDSRAKLDN